VIIAFDSDNKIILNLYYMILRQRFSCHQDTTGNNRANIYVTMNRISTSTYSLNLTGGKWQSKHSPSPLQCVVTLTREKWTLGRL